MENQDLIYKFKDYLQAGAEFNAWEIFSGGSFINKNFGGFPVASFYEVGHGIGYFS